MFSFLSTIKCSDYGQDHQITICISYDFNVYSLGYCKYSSDGQENDFTIFPIKQIQELSDIKMIDCGLSHSICLDYNGNVFSFGSNTYALLGIGKTKEELEKTHIPQKINLPPCKQVSCGDYFTICLTKDNRLYSFGHNDMGQLGLGNRKKILSPEQILSLNNVEYIVCGGDYSICKTYNNEFYSWGENYCGQLGQGNNSGCVEPIKCLNWPDTIIDIKCGYGHTLLLTSEGHVYSFGDNKNGQLGINDKNIFSINTPTLIKDIPEIQRIECGYDHSMCIDINNNLWIFGHNYYGQLGLGDTKTRYKPILHPTLSDIIDISSGGNHTFVKTIDNKIYAFGYNEYLQLGSEEDDIQETPIRVFKDIEDIWCSTIGKSKAKSARK